MSSADFPSFVNSLKAEFAERERNLEARLSRTSGAFLTSIIAGLEQFRQVAPETQSLSGEDIVAIMDTIRSILVGESDGSPSRYLPRLFDSVINGSLRRLDERIRQIREEVDRLDALTQGLQEEYVLSRHYLDTNQRLLSSFSEEDAQYAEISAALDAAGENVRRYEMYSKKLEGRRADLAATKEKRTLLIRSMQDDIRQIRSYCNAFPVE